ncbi:hypothetical protein SNEBB_004182 [Seison nebaliae]|nr:hypothetical protein SNEBB_004182 [Seison nebaliae]
MLPFALFHIPFILSLFFNISLNQLLSKNRQQNKLCHFPFLWKGNLFNKCIINISNKNKVFWCSVTFDFETDQKWKFCNFNEVLTKNLDKNKLRNCYRFDEREEIYEKCPPNNCRLSIDNIYGCLCEFGYVGDPWKNMCKFPREALSNQNSYSKSSINVSDVAHLINEDNLMKSKISDVELTTNQSCLIKETNRSVVHGEMNYFINPCNVECTCNNGRHECMQISCPNFDRNVCLQFQYVPNKCCPICIKDIYSEY